MDERRRAVRWQINQRAELTVENGIKSIPCVVEDISPLGARLSLSKELFDDCFSNFRLALADGCEFDAGAQVVWSEKVFERNIYGICFNRIEEPAKNRIAEYVKVNNPGEIARQCWKGL